MASCGEDISYEAMLRSAFRKAGDCGALAFVYSSDVGPLDCQMETLEAVAKAHASGIFQADQVDCDDCTAIDCDAPATWEMLREILREGESGHILRIVTAIDDAPCADTCGMDTVEMLRRCFVTDTGQRRLRTVIVADEGDMMDCDTAGLSVEELLRMCMVDLGDGAFAVRVYEQG